MYDQKFDMSIGYAETFFSITYSKNNISSVPFWFPIREGIAVLWLCLVSPICFPGSPLRFWPPLDYIKKKRKRTTSIHIDTCWNIWKYYEILASLLLSTKWICLNKRMLSTILFKTFKGSCSMCCNEIPKLQWHVKLFQGNHRRFLDQIMKSMYGYKTHAENMEVAMEKCGCFSKPDGICHLSVFQVHLLNKDSRITFC